MDRGYGKLSGRFDIGMSEFINAIPTILGATGSFIIALAVATFIKKLGAFVDKIQA